MKDQGGGESARDPWAVDLCVGMEVAPPGGEPLDREAFFGWLWDRAGGILGICEGAVGVDEAVKFGLAASPRVLDVAAAPAGRDWVGSLATAAVTLWFSDEAAARAVAALLEGVAGARVVGVRREPAAADADAWKKAFGPIDIPGFGIVRPAWDPGTAATGHGGTTVFIEPGAGFGTGLHETTRLCLQALAAWAGEGGSLGRVLDFGSGSGILGIAAAVRGADAVDAVEIDVRVHDAIRENARRNGVADRVSVWREMPPDDVRYDLVLANIVATVLLERADDLAGRLRRGGPAGCLVLSGLLADDVPTVAKRYLTLGPALVETSMGEWRCLRFVADST